VLKPKLRKGKMRWRWSCTGKAGAGKEKGSSLTPRGGGENFWGKKQLMEKRAKSDKVGKRGQRILAVRHKAVIVTNGGVNGPHQLSGLS